MGWKLKEMERNDCKAEECEMAGIQWTHRNFEELYEGYKIFTLVFLPELWDAWLAALGHFIAVSIQNLKTGHEHAEVLVGIGVWQLEQDGEAVLLAQQQPVVRGSQLQPRRGEPAGPGSVGARSELEVNLFLVNLQEQWTRFQLAFWEFCK